MLSDVEIYIVLQILSWGHPMDHGQVKPKLSVKTLTSNVVYIKQPPTNFTAKQLNGKTLSKHSDHQRTIESDKNIYILTTAPQCNKSLLTKSNQPIMSV